MLHIVQRIAGETCIVPATHATRGEWRVAANSPAGPSTSLADSALARKERACVCVCVC